MNKIIGSLLLFCLLFSGCAPASITTDQRLSLKPCTVKGVEAECGTLHVPEDRAHPDGRSLDLDIVVLRARKPNHEPDPLFYIAGGPGNAATSPDIVYGVHCLLWNVNDLRDLVFLDQRGTNGKHRLTCDFIPDE